MSLFLATLVFGLGFAGLGAVLLMNRPAAIAGLQKFLRSEAAAQVLFGGGALWFLWLVWNLPAADFGEYHVWLTVGFAAVAVLSFKYVPDFLAVRGLCVLVLLTASPLLRAAYMEYDHPQRLLMVTPVYLLIVAAIWLGAQPYRLRDLFAWLFSQPGRSRGLGAALLVYGVVLAGVAFTY